ncbi:hypothetical protein [Nocardia sp. NPDC003963]
MLTATYAIGQVAGPLLVIPVIGTDFTTAFTIAAVTITLAAIPALAADRARIRMRGTPTGTSATPERDSRTVADARQHPHDQPISAPEHL